MERPGTKAADGSRFAVFLEQYAFDEPWRAVKEESGMNNTTRMVYADGRKYVLRVYDNHCDPAIVTVEHAVLLGLSRSRLRFQVPRPVSNRGGGTITAAKDGKLAALYGYIQGTRPSADDRDHIRGLGAAAGELSVALKTASIAAAPLYTPYYDFAETHGWAEGEVLHRLAERESGTGGCRRELELLLAERVRLAALKERFAALPRQWIHGDLNFTNAVAREDQIAGLLDFEFCAVDARAMEPAVVLAEFPDADLEAALDKFALFCEGFGRHVRLSGDEIRLLPELIKLRMMDVVLHFAGRFREGLDPGSVWEGQIRRAAFVTEWLDGHRGALAALFERYFA
ncbi:phosphotransferase [Paenibacillus humicola]|uniref:phosphotransferase n=1 Tax=Paenibacillus humicola TaxID=3110540 RepID=UPI00237B8D0C|nr:phosphotransferase [Paenibacillus humicola]